jgi:hypothetical protein
MDWIDLALDTEVAGACEHGTGRMRHGMDHPSPLTTKVEERAELYLCSSPGPWWHVLKELS